MLTITAAQPDTLIFKLTPKVLQIPEITVTAKDMKEWRKRLKKFTGLLFNTTGYPYDPLQVETYGYWAWQRVADMLPFDYVPPSQELQTAQAEQEQRAHRFASQFTDDCFDLALRFPGRK